MDFKLLTDEDFAKLSRKINEIYDKVDRILSDKEDEMSEKWITSAKVCKILHIGPRLLAEKRHTGQIPYTKIGRKIYYLPKDIEDYLRKNYKK